MRPTRRTAASTDQRQFHRSARYGSIQRVHRLIREARIVTDAEVIELGQLLMLDDQRGVVVAIVESIAAAEHIQSAADGRRSVGGKPAIHGLRQAQRAAREVLTYRERCARGESAARNQAARHRRVNTIAGKKGPTEVAGLEPAIDACRFPDSAPRVADAEALDVEHVCKIAVRFLRPRALCRGRLLITTLCRGRNRLRRHRFARQYRQTEHR